MNDIAGGKASSGPTDEGSETTQRVALDIVAGWAQVLIFATELLIVDIR